MNELKENLSYWKEFLMDKRFTLRFKIANLIMGDDLRATLAFINMEAVNTIEHEKLYAELPEVKSKLNLMRAEKIKRWISDLWMKGE